MSSTTLRVLMLCDHASGQGRVTMQDHLECFEQATPGRVQITYADPLIHPFEEAWLDMDAVVLHTTVVCKRWSYLFGATLKALQWLEQYQGVVVAIPQDEYDHAHLLDEWLLMYRTAVVVSCFDERHRALLYPRMHRAALFLHALTGYVNPRRVTDIRNAVHGVTSRPVDLFYRARSLPAWFGWLGWMKGALGGVAPQLLDGAGYALDVSVRREDTIVGDAWFTALASSVATMGSESGSSVLDRRGDVQRHVKALLEEQPDLDFFALNRLMDGELTRHRFAALGPRHLEAMMTGTVQLLVEGDYSGLLKPWKHYIPLRPDLADLREKMALTRDRALVQQITERCAAEFVDGPDWTYGRFADRMLDAIEAVQAARRQASATAVTPARAA